MKTKSNLPPKISRRFADRIVCLDGKQATGDLQTAGLPYLAAPELVKSFRVFVAESSKLVVVVSAGFRTRVWLLPSIA